MDEYFFLFRPSKIFNEYRAQLELMRNFDKSLKKLNNSNTQFLSYKEFLNYCKKQKMVERK